MTAEQFGPYRLDGLIGRGGMGEVFDAFDTVRNRRVALKRLPSEFAADPLFASRFRRESAVAARLDDPHIIPIHDYGEIDGQLFLDMRLVAGRDLAAILEDAGSLEPERAVNLIGQIAQALDAAHRDGLLHRDVKPSNVLVSGDGGNEFAYLIDFGIAKTLSASDGASLTSVGAAVGTLAYMAPERFMEGDVGCAADVYSLGAVLFESLTGTKPFRGDDVTIIGAQLHREPPRPSTRRPGVPPGLDQVVARGMAKDPHDRYRTAGELAAAARAAIDAGMSQLSRPFGRLADPRDVPVSAEADPNDSVEPPIVPDRPGMVVRSEPISGEVARRRVWLRIVVASVLALALAAGVLVLILRNKPQAPTAGGASHQALVVSTIPVLAPRGVAVSPDGGRVYVTNSSYGTVSVVDPIRGVISTTIPVGEQPLAVALDPVGTTAFVANADSDSVSVIDTMTAQSVTTIPVGSRPVAVTVSPDGRHAYSANIVAATISVIDTHARAVVATIKVDKDPTDIAVSPDGRLLYVADASGRSVTIADTTTATIIRKIVLPGPPSDIALTPDGRRLYVTHPDSDSVSVVDLQSATTTATVQVGDNPSDLAIDPTGSKVYVANTLASTVSIIDTRDNSTKSTITVGTRPVGVAVSPDGGKAYVANYDSGTLSVAEAPD